MPHVSFASSAALVRSVEKRGINQVQGRERTLTILLYPRKVVEKLIPWCYNYFVFLYLGAWRSS